MANSEIPAIIQGVIPLVHEATADGVSTCGGDFHAVRRVLSEEIIAGSAPSTARVFKDPTLVNWKVTIRPIPIDMNTVGVTPRSTNLIRIGTGTSASLIQLRRQDIDSPRVSVGTQKSRNSHPFKTSINQSSPEHGHPTPIFSKVIGRKTVHDKSADVYARKRMEFGSNSVVSESPNFMDFGLSPANTPDKLKYVIFPTTRFGILTKASN